MKRTYALLNLLLGCLQRGHRQSSGRSSKATLLKCNGFHNGLLGYSIYKDKYFNYKNDIYRLPILLGAIPNSFLNIRVRFCGYSNPSASETSETLRPSNSMDLAFCITK